jgi:hypothetical protein
MTPFVAFHTLLGLIFEFLWECAGIADIYAICYGQLAVMSDMDDGGVCPECRQRMERSAVL